MRLSLLCRAADVVCRLRRRTALLGITGAAAALCLAHPATLAADVPTTDVPTVAVVAVWMAPSVPEDRVDLETRDAMHAAVADAFARWSDAGSGVTFRFVADSSRAEIRVRFVACGADTDGQPIDAITRWSRSALGRLRRAEVQLCVTRADGAVVDLPSVRALALHEVGHLLGLEHVDAPDRIMSPVVRVRDLTEADVAAMRRRSAYRLLR